MNRTDVARIHDLLTAGEIAEARRRGVDVDEIAWQYETLQNPPASLRIARPATIGDGIVRLGPADEARLDSRGALVAERGDVTRFVPASGAATRMFADLAAALDAPSELASTEVERFFAHLDEFPFAAALRELTGVEEQSTADHDVRRRMLESLLRRTGLGLGALPKGLVPFHRYDGESRTAAGEHVREAALHARSSDGVVRMHLTVPEKARQAFETELQSQADAAGVELSASLSVQDPSTDTLAIDDDDRFFRDESGSLVWRPGGHGSLLRNLALVDTAYASIKNVDNVRREEDHAAVARWKRILAGLLDETRDRMKEFRAGGDAEIGAALEWVARTFGRRPLSGEDPGVFLEACLQRPVRVCGVVRNEGEPGGAPFWVRGNSGGDESLQIVEASQIDRRDPEQHAIFRSSTHFNPVDIAASLVDLDGNAIDLHQYVDRGAVFVAMKSYGSSSVRVLERPGLWNGAMAGWNTICVEVPSFTFAPVKTVFDLLRDEHRGR